MDDGIRINTTQNVLINYQPAGVGDRILASLLDLLFVIAYIAVIAIIMSAIGHTFDGSDDEQMTAIVITTILTLPLMFYNLLMEQFLGGQTLGKKIMKIKVLKLDGSQPNFGAYLVRWVFRIVDFMLFNGVVALIAVAVSEKAQRLGDMAAGTTVVSLKQKVSLQNTILYRPKVEHQIVFNEVNKLSDKDVGIIKEVFDHCTINSDYNGLKQLASKVKAKMEITSAMPDSQFIKVVLLDYSQYQFEK
jgi:uncharacterized RDD family membrane protein YckC